jgi:fluoride ion exporter CrcB/FEX
VTNFLFIMNLFLIAIGGALGSVARYYQKLTTL